jgi:branched-chain amino acid transport system substrate-binding protein
MVSPFSTAPKLTRQGFTRVFRTVPSDAVFGTQMARFAYGRNFRRVMIYQAQNSYGTGLANAFERECEVLGIAVPDRLGYDSLSDARIFRRDLIRWANNFQFDAIFIAGSSPQASTFIKEARGQGIRAAILGGDGLDTPELAGLAGEAAEGTFVGSTYFPDDPRSEVAEFVAAFTMKYGWTPDASAALGYDTVRVLARAMEDARSAVPDEVAEALRRMTGLVGVTGIYRFDANGDLEDRDIRIKVVRDGELRPFGE